MPLSVTELTRRAELESYAKQQPKVELEAQEMRQRIIAEFTKKLDGAIKNLQEGEGLAVTFTIDIIGPGGKIRKGSGAQRNMPEYIEWRRAVYERDGYTCQRCGSGKDLNAHHVKPWSQHPALRFDIDNGVTLCRDCHTKEHPHIGWVQ